MKSRIVPLSLLALTLAVPAGAAEPQAIPPAQLDTLQKMIQPQAGESRFWQIPWLLNLDEALLKGAAEGKPVFLWSGAGGSPHTVC
ncbi:MAG: hypothetical protein JNM56_01380 [Planctomycetia bacterium]|nr:hypothetical protein [Planctomycetia bacterium]